MKTTKPWRLGDVGWKWLISILCAFCALLLILEFLHGLAVLTGGGHYGSIGIENGPGVQPERFGTHRFKVPEAYVAQLHAQPGDLIGFASPVDRLRKLKLGKAHADEHGNESGNEKVNVLLWRDGNPQPEAHVLEAGAKELTPIDRFDYITRFALAAPALLFALLLGLKRPDSNPHRALSLCFVFLSLCPFMAFCFSPRGPALSIGWMANLLSYPWIWFMTVYFARYYASRFPQWLRRAMVVLLPGFGAMSVAATVTGVWFGLGHETPWQGPLMLLTLVVGEVLIYACMIGGWLSSRGEMRQRHAWLLLSFSFGSVPTLLAFVSTIDATFGGGVPVTSALAQLGQVLMDIGLAYAVLKHRVFNFDFAISRAVVYSVISMVVLVIFGVVKWATELWVHGGGGAAEHGGSSLWSDGAIALVIYLVFHQIHDRLEHRIERVIFQRWHQNEKALRDFAREASHYSSTEMLLKNLHKALERFSGGAGAVIYLKLAGGAYAQVYGTIPQAPHLLDGDDTLIVSLRDRPAASRLAEHHGTTEARGSLAFAMSHRGLLHGLVVMGHKHGGESYRPDEVSVLEFVINQVGLDFQALIAAKLERDMERLSQEHERQREQLQFQRELLAELKPH